MKQTQHLTSPPENEISEIPSSSEKVQFLTGKILSQTGSSYLVSAKGHQFNATRAFDCLTKPETGDLIVLTVTSQGSFISQILSRASDIPLQLAVTADLSIASEGMVKLSGQKGVQIQSPGELEVSSEKLAVNNLSTRFRTLNLFFQAKEAESNVGRIKIIADWIEQKAETIRQRFTRSDRVVREADQQQAGSLVQRVEKTASLRAEHTIIKARKDVQVDGKRIHMG